MKRVKVSVAEGYARWAETYDGYPNALIVAEEPIVRRLLGDVRGKRVLDAGCGTGRHTAWLDEHGADVVGVDASREMLARAKEKAPAVRWVEGSLDALPFDAASFDVVLCALVLEHGVDVSAPLHELVRVLRPGGSLVVSVYHGAFVSKGVPPHFVAPDGFEYEMPGHAFFASDYVTPLLESGLTLTHLLEPRVDDAIILARPNMEKHRGLPIAVILRAALLSHP